MSETAMTRPISPSRCEVFLSYSHDDREIVEKIARVICDAGFSCWIDKERLRAQENYNAAIDLAIDGAVVFVAFLSKTYVNKPYCIHEFDRAIDKQMSILAVCIDDVHEGTNRQAAYLFSFSAGHNVLGFGQGVGMAAGTEGSGAGETAPGDEAIADYARQIIASVPLQQLKRYDATGDAADYPPVSTPDYLLARLRLYHEQQYEQSGNYALSEIRSELFPAVRDTQIDVLYRDDRKQEVSLVRYLTSPDAGEGGRRRHVFITGEGGMGKTVSLLRTCEYLLGRRINAIYVPLSKIDADMTLDQYLERMVCGGNKRLWEDLRALMSTPYSSAPNVVLLLDGLNEIPLDYVSRFVDRGLTAYLDGYAGIRMVMTSRWFDPSLLHAIKDKVDILEMQALDEEAIGRYLESMGLPLVTDRKILSVIRTPLMLTLYADVEKHKEKYQDIEGIELEETPDTAGKILSNFFQTQLYRAAREGTFDRAAHLVLLEYLLPALAFRMLEKQRMFLSEDEVWDGIDEISDGGTRFGWYRSDRLRRLVRGRGGIDADALFALAENALHFLHKSDAGYEFLHQSFRDYFAAFHIANEMRALVKKPERLQEASPLLQEKVYPEEILGFVSDITHEEKAQPVRTEDGWHFPGKEEPDGAAQSGAASGAGMRAFGQGDAARGVGMSAFEESGAALCAGMPAVRKSEAASGARMPASAESAAEQLLGLWRGESGEAAQNAVANLFGVMRTGRRRILAGCDFSRLDMRGCWLNGCIFTVWHEESYHPCSFDGAWLDRANFLTDGHEARITAVASDGAGQVFSGDESGTVKIYDLKKRAWTDTFQPQPGTVTGLAWDGKSGRLAVLYASAVHCFSLAKRKVTESFGNGSRSKNFRYVRFSEEGDILVSYDAEPLIWFEVNGRRLPTPLSYDVPARCAVWRPGRKEFVRSYLLQLITAIRFDEDRSAWRLVPALQKRLAKENAKRRKERLPEKTEMYMSLREAGADRAGSISCIQYSGDGTRLLAAIRDLLIEYDADTFAVKRRRTFSDSVGCACYIPGGVAAGVGMDLVLLDRDLSETACMRGAQIRSITAAAEDNDGDGYFVFSANGTVKKLSHDLIVQSMRRTDNRSGFVWARDRMTGRVDMAFLPTQKYPNGSRYSYETDQAGPLGWCYELLDPPEYSDSNEQRFYKLDTELMVVGRFPPYRKIFYTNYAGIWIFRCSFRAVQGGMAEHRGRSFLIQNGGIADDDE